MVAGVFLSEFVDRMAEYSHNFKLTLWAYGPCELKAAVIAIMDKKVNYYIYLFISSSSSCYYYYLAVVIYIAYLTHFCRLFLDKPSVFAYKQTLTVYLKMVTKVIFN